ncbi:hypothetical protein VTP01DRAFT_2557 [Rhizomucor pusillus]|uniref:uncharacterized protein n=1 Tax=Rhizomucor pusillus TaxID=4840 RepID=UPI0037441899
MKHSSLPPPISVAFPLSRLSLTHTHIYIHNSIYISKCIYSSKQSPSIFVVLSSILYSWTRLIHKVLTTRSIFRRV